MGLEELAFEMLVVPQYRLPMLNAVRIPAGVEEADKQKIHVKKYDIEIGGSLGLLTGKGWRTAGLREAR